MKEVTLRKSKRTINLITTNQRNAASRLKHEEKTSKMALSSLSMAVPLLVGPEGVKTFESSRHHAL
jgi:small neutral amino acid transporter SnatA (MarC family)